MAFFSLCCFSVRPSIAPILASGCEDDTECPQYNACNNRKCTDPCVLANPCATNAACLTVNHQTICSCPDGYLGNPKTACEKRKDNGYFLMDFAVFNFYF